MGDKIKMMATGKEFDVIELGVFNPKTELLDELTVGDVGFYQQRLKMWGYTVGDTITSAKNSATEPLLGIVK